MPFHFQAIPQWPPDQMTKYFQVPLLLDQICIGRVSWRSPLRDESLRRKCESHYRAIWSNSKIGVKKCNFTFPWSFSWMSKGERTRARELHCRNKHLQWGLCQQPGPEEKSDCVYIFVPLFMPLFWSVFVPVLVCRLFVITRLIFCFFRLSWCGVQWMRKWRRPMGKATLTKR